jgi:hypothetical protein
VSVDLSIDGIHIQCHRWQQARVANLPDPLHHTAMDCGDPGFESRELFAGESAGQPSGAVVEAGAGVDTSVWPAVSARIRSSATRWSPPVGWQETNATTNSPAVRPQSRCLMAGMWASSALVMPSRSSSA